MDSILRFGKLCYMFPIKCSQLKSKPSNRIDGIAVEEEKQQSKRRKVRHQWKCIDNCCWLIGYLVTTWWLLMFLYQCLPAFQSPELPGERLRRDEGLTPLHPMVLIPDIVTGGLELWEGRPCAEGLFRKRLWGGSFAQLFKRLRCWLEHLSLDNETGLDPPGIRVRAVPGLVAADCFAPGCFVWAVLIQNLAKIGYEEKNMYMAAYDWRLSFQNTEIRDQTLSRLKSKIELMYTTNGHKKVVVVPHSMGAIYFLHFLKWVETSLPMGGGAGPGWCAKHIQAIMNIAPTFLGVPKTIGNILSAETKDIDFIRSMARVVFDSELLGLRTQEHMLRVGRTWDSLISLFPKGGETIWGNMDWSPEEDQDCNFMKRTFSQSIRLGDSKSHITDTRQSIQVKEGGVKYGRIVSFGKMAAQLSSFLLPTLTHKEFVPKSKMTARSNISCGNVWTEYNELSRETIAGVAQNKTYTADTFLDLFRLLAPKMMQRAEAHISHGIADDLDDPKYSHYKYWSNPLETKLPDAPDVEMYCLYGVGIPTERSYIYKLSNLGKCNSIPYRIDSSADGSHGHDSGCLKNGVNFVDGDDSVPLISAGFMCAKGWRGKTRFNPSGMATYIREYEHKAPTSLLEGRGLESGNHVDIMGNVVLIEDILRVAAGANGQDLGRDRIFSSIMKMSDKIKLKL